MTDAPPEKRGKKTKQTDIMTLWRSSSSRESSTPTPTESSGSCRGREINDTVASPSTSTVTESGIVTVTEIEPTSSVQDLGDFNSGPIQPHLKTYAPTIYGVKTRDFSQLWYTGRHWLEFSQELKTAFCYCCRIYCNSSSSDIVFTKTGYSNWHHALEKRKGLTKHSNSYSHISAMQTWMERNKRKETSTSISTLLNDKQIEKNRYYIKSIVQVIQFLCINELPLRGNNHEGIDALDPGTIDYPCGLFMRLFEYTLSKYEKLKEYFTTIPKNATYSSVMIQNEVIEIMKNTVVDSLVSEIKSADIEFFTIKSDGTRDPTNTENISIVIRYVRNGKVNESLLDMPSTDDLDAESIASLILASLEKSGLEPSKVLSQCYDGAAVMSGKYGGVQKKIKEKLKKEVPYVHCYNHQLHLVVVHAMEMNDVVRMFFESCNNLYNFIRRPNVHKLYDGTMLKRLLDQRWSGHLETVSAVIKNHDKLVDLLEYSEDNGNDVSIRITSTGLIKQIKARKFLFIAYIVHDILSYFKPVDAMLQSSSCDLLTASRLIDMVLEVVTNFRGNEKYFSTTMEKLNDHQLNNDDVPRRRPKIPQRLEDNSVIESSLGHSHMNVDSDSRKSEYFGIFCELFDNCIGEIRSRFNERNDSVLASISVLWPDSEDFLDPSKLRSLADLISIDVISFKCQCEVAKCYIKCQFRPVHRNLEDIYGIILPTKEALPEVCKLYAAALTFGASTAACEASFSTLSRVLNPYRRSMTHERKSNLVILSFLHKHTRTLDLDKFIVNFAAKSRKIRLV